MPLVYLFNFLRLFSFMFAFQILTGLMSLSFAHRRTFAKFGTQNSRVIITVATKLLIYAAVSNLIQLQDQ